MKNCEILLKIERQSDLQLQLLQEIYHGIKNLKTHSGGIEGQLVRDLATGNRSTGATNLMSLL